MKTVAENITALRGIGISHPYASQIAHGKRPPSQKMAVRIYRHTGMRFGPVVGLSDAQIDVLETIHGAA